MGTAAAAIGPATGGYRPFARQYGCCMRARAGRVTDGGRLRALPGPSDWLAGRWLVALRRAVRGPLACRRPHFESGVAPQGIASGSVRSYGLVLPNSGPAASALDPGSLTTAFNRRGTGHWAPLDFPSEAPGRCTLFSPSAPPPPLPFSHRGRCIRSPLSARTGPLRTCTGRCTASAKSLGKSKKMCVRVR